MELYGLGVTNIRQRNMGYLKRYSDTHFKLVHMNSVRLPGFEARDETKRPRNRESDSTSEKLRSSLARSRSTVWELAICNPWEHFVTLTINGNKHDRHDLPGTYKHLAKWINNYNSRSDATLRYLLVPEPHQDGAWHFHGLLMGLPSSHLTRFTQRDSIPQRLKGMLREGRQLFTWPAYAAAFGFVTIEQIAGLERCAAYMTKYITKDLQASSIELNHHLYYCSHGLKRAELLYSGPITHAIEDPDFENDYVHIKNFSSAEEALPYFCDLEE